MPVLKFARGQRLDLVVGGGENLMKALVSQNVPVASSCGGDGVCAKCRINVLSGGENLSPITELEKFLLERNKIPAGARISCQVQILDEPDSIITIDTGYW